MSSEDFVDGRGKHMVIPISDWRKQRYLDWLLTPPRDRQPRSKIELAEELGLDRRTLTNWQNDTDFLKEWEKKYLKTIGSPERKQTLMDTLYQTGSDPDDPKHVQAVKTYFEIEGSLRPQKMEVTVTKNASELSDEALDALISAHAQSERERREAERP